MSGLRKLAVAYLVSASAFGLAAPLASHPNASGAARDMAYLLVKRVWRSSVDYAWRADALLLDGSGAQSNAHVMLALAPPVPGEERAHANYDIPAIARARLINIPRQSPDLEVVAPVIVAPDLPLPPPQTLNQKKPIQGAPRIADVPRESAGSMTPEEARAAAHLAASLTPAMRAHFDLFLFVSKAASGPLAQRMYVFRQDKGELSLAYDWAASTGREQQEVNPRGTRSFTSTPGGFYQFDPGRMYVRYRSYVWDRDMPYAMFFNWQHEGLQSGLAIHAASGSDIGRLGRRASAGCIHLSPDNARTLFYLVRGAYQGAVPRFASDSDDTMSRDGRFARDANGRLKMTAGYRVLIDIENYGGAGSDNVAALF